MAPARAAVGGAGVPFFARVSPGGWAPTGGPQPRRGDAMNSGQVWRDVSEAADLRRLIRDVPDFPKPGVLFKDITPLLRDASGLALAVELMVQPFRGTHVDVVVGAESRGFIFGTAAAKSLSVGFVPIRKPGKLPRSTRRVEYALEYGTDALEMHADALQPGQNVLIVDDVLATGGTLAACCGLVRAAGARIQAVAVLIELPKLGGRALLGDVPVFSVISYPK